MVFLTPPGGQRKARPPLFSSACTHSATRRTGDRLLWDGRAVTMFRTRAVTKRLSVVGYRLSVAPLGRAFVPDGARAQQPTPDTRHPTTNNGCSAWARF